jgi:hypothetical protein
VLLLLLLLLLLYVAAALDAKVEPPKPPLLPLRAARGGLVAIVATAKPAAAPVLPVEAGSTSTVVVMVFPGTPEPVTAAATALANECGFTASAPFIASRLDAGATPGWALASRCRLTRLRAPCLDDALALDRSGNLCWATYDAETSAAAASAGGGAAALRPP